MREACSGPRSSQSWRQSASKGGPSPGSLRAVDWPARAGLPGRERLLLALLGETLGAGQLRVSVGVLGPDDGLALRAVRPGLGKGMARARTSLGQRAALRVEVDGRLAVVARLGGLEQRGDLLRKAILELVAARRGQVLAQESADELDVLHAEAHADVLAACHAAEELREIERRAVRGLPEGTGELCREVVRQRLRPGVPQPLAQRPDDQDQDL